MNLLKYKTLVFDCDGVVLDSNKVKTDAFYKVALPYGEKAAQVLVDYHIANGGISRYKKFQYFLREIVNETDRDHGTEQLLGAFACEVRKGLLTCGVAQGLQELRKQTRNANWLIVSGGDQAELKEIFNKRALASLFDGGIFGSPDTKDQILTREINNFNIKKPAVFLGDSKYDLEAAKRAGLDFIFVSSWSEWTPVKSCETKIDYNIMHLKEIIANS